MKHYNSTYMAPQVPSDVNSADLVTALITEPTTAVAICRLTGDVLYANNLAARIYLGDDAAADDFAGHSLWELFPDEWVRERLMIGLRAVRNGRPILVRTIWHGHQMFSWLYPLDTASEPGSDDPNARVMIVSRRVAAGQDVNEFLDDGTEMIESEVMRLGKIDVLSPREMEVLAMVGQGMSIREIAQVLCRSEKTIQNHRDSIGSKLGLGNRVKVAEVAKQAALTTRDARRTRV